MQFLFLKFRKVGWDCVHLVRRPLIVLLYQPRMVDEYGAFGGMKIGRGNRSTRRNPAPVPFSLPHIPHDPTWDRTRAPAVGNRRLTAWGMARPLIGSYFHFYVSPCTWMFCSGEWNLWNYAVSCYHRNECRTVIIFMDVCYVEGHKWAVIFSNNEWLPMEPGSL
jgi:hypothetical protein